MRSYYDSNTITVENASYYIFKIDIINNKYCLYCKENVDVNAAATQYLMSFNIIFVVAPNPSPFY